MAAVDGKTLWLLWFTLSWRFPPPGGQNAPVAVKVSPVHRIVCRMVYRRLRPGTATSFL